jgi:hypothetical protein
VRKRPTLKYNSENKAFSTKMLGAFSLEIIYGKVGAKTTSFEACAFHK